MKASSLTEWTNSGQQTVTIFGTTAEAIIFCTGRLSELLVGYIEYSWRNRMNTATKNARTHFYEIISLLRDDVLSKDTRGFRVDDFDECLENAVSVVRDSYERMLSGDCSTCSHLEVVNAEGNSIAICHHSDTTLGDPIAEYVTAQPLDRMLRQVVRGALETCCKFHYFEGKDAAQWKLRALEKLMLT